MLQALTCIRNAGDAFARRRQETAEFLSFPFFFFFFFLFHSSLFFSTSTIMPLFHGILPVPIEKCPSYPINRVFLQWKGVKRSTPRRTRKNDERAFPGHLRAEMRPRGPFHEELEEILRRRDWVLMLPRNRGNRCGVKRFYSCWWSINAGFRLPNRVSQLQMERN